MKTSTSSAEWICKECGAVEGDYHETIITCECKGNKIGNMDATFKAAIEQAKLLHEKLSN